VKALHNKAFSPLKKEKKKKRKKKSGFFTKNSPMPSLKLGRFNLAKARLRGCFFQMIIENQKQKKAKATMYSLRSYFLKSKSSKVRTHSGCSVPTV
jgi:hypothetical protein